MRLLRHVVATLIVVAAAACGGSGNSPTAPSPPPPAAPTTPPTVANIAGEWAGRISAVLEGEPGSIGVSVTLQQSGDQITGRWHQPGSTNWRGELAGSLSGFGVGTTFAGTVTWDAERSTGTGRCVGRSTVSGTGSEPVLTWTSTDVVFDNCSGVLTQVRWVLTR